MNFPALIVSALVPMIVGFIWYHEKVFGTIWKEAAGLTDEKIRSGNMALIFGLSFLFSLLMAVCMNTIAYHDSFIQGATYYATGGTMNPDPASELGQWVAYYKTNLAESNHTFKHGAFHGFLIGGLFLALPMLATNGLFERKSFKYIAVNVGYWLITFTLMGGIIAAWH